MQSLVKRLIIQFLRRARAQRPANIGQFPQTAIFPALFFTSAHNISPPTAPGRRKIMYICLSAASFSIFYLVLGRRRLGIAKYEKLRFSICLCARLSLSLRAFNSIKRIEPCVTQTFGTRPQRDSHRPSTASSTASESGCPS